MASSRAIAEACIKEDAQVARLPTQSKTRKLREYKRVKLFDDSTELSGHTTKYDAPAYLHVGSPYCSADLHAHCTECAHRGHSCWAYPNLDNCHGIICRMLAQGALHRICINLGRLNNDNFGELLYLLLERSSYVIFGPRDGCSNYCVVYASMAIAAALLCSPSLCDHNILGWP